MKVSTQKMIKNALIGPFSTNNSLELINQLFWIYAGQEIKSIDDLYEAPDDFCSFIMDSIHLFSNFESVNDYMNMYESICQFHDMLCNILGEENIDVQLLFAEMVRDLQPANHQSMLDVASGKIPISSIELAYDHDNVASMDKFILPAEALKKLGVDAINGFMDPKTDLSGYDFVVSRHPCESTGTLIKNCAKYNLPYFIHFCACGLPYDERRGVPSKLWEEKLRSLDPRIQFTTFEAKIDAKSAYKMRFGYMLDIPQNEVEEYLKSKYIVHIPNKEAINIAKEKLLYSIKNKQPGE